MLNLRFLELKNYNNFITKKIIIIFYFKIKITKMILLVMIVMRVFLKMKIFRYQKIKQIIINYLITIIKMMMMKTI